MTDPTAFIHWCGDRLEEAARLVPRKTGVRKIADEAGTSLSALADSGLVDFNSDGDPVFQVVDVEGSYAPKWMRSIPDRWELEGDCP